MTIKGKCISVATHRNDNNGKPSVNENVQFAIVPPSSGVVGEVSPSAGTINLVITDEAAVGQYKAGQVYDFGTP